MAGLAAGPKHTRRLAPRCPGRRIPQRSNYWVSVNWASLASAEKQGNRTRGDDPAARNGRTQLSVSSRYAPAVSKPSTAAGSSGVISTNHPAPYGSVLITSGVSANASLRAATVPLNGA